MEITLFQNDLIRWVCEWLEVNDCLNFQVCLRRKLYTRKYYRGRLAYEHYYEDHEQTKSIKYGDIWVNYDRKPYPSIIHIKTHYLHNIFGEYELWSNITHRERGAWWGLIPVDCHVLIRHKKMVPTMVGTHRVFKRLFNGEINLTQYNSGKFLIV